MSFIFCCSYGEEESRDRELHLMDSTVETLNGVKQRASPLNPSEWLGVIISPHWATKSISVSCARACDLELFGLR